MAEIVTQETPQEENPVPADTSPSRSDRRWVIGIAALTMALTLVPYLIGWSFAQGRQFMWLGYNLDDSCVYLSWMRQAADGSVRALNLFTTDAQHGMLLNPLFLVLGWLARLTGLPLIGVYHLARLGFGFALLLVTWKFITLTVSGGAARRYGLLCVCFSSGLGWLPGLWEASPIQTPIDKWQPEAITFLSLYLSPLFCFSMLLQVAILALLFSGERSGKWVCGMAAGACGFLLALVHTYDVISVAAVWIVYLVFLALRQIRATQNGASGLSGLSGSLLRALVAGAITAPAVLYIYLQLQTEATFQKRANVLTLSPMPFWVALGYGLTLALAALGVWGSRGSPGAKTGMVSPTPDTSGFEGAAGLVGNSEGTRLLITWAVVNVLTAYLPATLFPFQRKMLQGAHFPIAILAGIGLAWLLSQAAVRKPIRSPRFAAGVVVGLLALTNIRFMARDLSNYRDNLSQTFQQRPFLNPGELEALDWVRDHTPGEASIQPLPWLAQAGERKIAVSDMSVACFAPSRIHRAVYCGHWGETPEYQEKLQELTRLVRPDTSDEARTALLRKMKVQYLIFTQKDPQDTFAAAFFAIFRNPDRLPAYLSLVHDNPDASVFEVKLPE